MIIILILSVITNLVFALYVLRSHNFLISLQNTDAHLVSAQVDQGTFMADLEERMEVLEAKADRPRPKKPVADRPRAKKQTRKKVAA